MLLPANTAVFRSVLTFGDIIRGQQTRRREREMRKGEEFDRHSDGSFYVLLYDISTAAEFCGVWNGRGLWGACSSAGLNVFCLFPMLLAGAVV